MELMKRNGEAERYIFLCQLDRKDKIRKVDEVVWNILVLCSGQVMSPSLQNERDHLGNSGSPLGGSFSVP